MADESNLESLSHEHGVIAASDALRQAAYIQDLEATHRQSLEDNEGFWANDVPFATESARSAECAQ